MFYAGLKSDGTAVKISILRGPKDADEYVYAKTYAEALQFMVDILDKYYPDQEPQVSITCSSSIDWPEDYTDDPQIIALCDKIRNGD
jgi:hypothetical protein